MKDMLAKLRVLHDNYLSKGYNSYWKPLKTTAVFNALNRLNAEQLHGLNEAMSMRVEYQRDMCRKEDRIGFYNVVVGGRCNGPFNILFEGVERLERDYAADLAHVDAAPTLPQKPLCGYSRLVSLDGQVGTPENLIRRALSR